MEQRIADEAGDAFVAHSLLAHRHRLQHAASRRASAGGPLVPTVIILEIAHTSERTDERTADERRTADGRTDGRKRKQVLDGAIPFVCFAMHHMHRRFVAWLSWLVNRTKHQFVMRFVAWFGESNLYLLHATQDTQESPAPWVGEPPIQIPHSPLPNPLPRQIPQVIPPLMKSTWQTRLVATIRNKQSSTEVLSYYYYVYLQPLNDALQQHTTQEHYTRERTRPYNRKHLFA